MKLSNFKTNYFNGIKYIDRLYKSLLMRWVDLYLVNYTKDVLHK